MTDKPRSLDSIPYDIFYQIASRLDCYDFVNLSRVNRSTYSLTLTDSLARKTIEVNFNYTHCIIAPLTDLFRTRCYTPRKDKQHTETDLAIAELLAACSTSKRLSRQLNLFRPPF